MRKASISERRYKAKDFLIWMGIILFNYLIFLSVTLVVLVIKHFGYDEPFIPTTDEATGLFIYVITIGPFLNGSMHIMYDELGSPWTRLVMWINATAVIILIPISLLML